MGQAEKNSRKAGLLLLTIQKKVNNFTKMERLIFFLPFNLKSSTRTIEFVASEVGLNKNGFRTRQGSWEGRVHTESPWKPEVSVDWLHSSRFGCAQDSLKGTTSKMLNCFPHSSKTMGCVSRGVFLSPLGRAHEQLIHLRRNAKRLQLGGLSFVSWHCDAAPSTRTESQHTTRNQFRNVAALFRSPDVTPVGVSGGASSEAAVSLAFCNCLATESGVSKIRSTNLLDLHEIPLHAA